MRAHFALAAVIGMATAPAAAYDFMTLQQAQAHLFPGAQLKASFVELNDAQIAAIIKDSGISVLQRQLKVWRASTGGWFILDQVRGLDDVITYGLGLNSDGSVKGVEILVCQAIYEGIREPKWLAQFTGRRHADFGAAEDFTIVSGASLSSVHIAEGIKRNLAVHKIVLTPK